LFVARTGPSEPSWLESPRRRSLSLSLLISGSLEIQGQQVRNYFDNLLPDNERIRSRLRRRFGLRSGEIFDLLEAIGRDFGDRASQFSQRKARWSEDCPRTSRLTPGKASRRA
jgi:HipA-like protein